MRGPTHSAAIPVPSVFGICLALAVAGRAETPALSDAAIEAFLLGARIVDQETIEVGVTRSRRATLTDGRLTHDAQIQTIDEFHGRLRTPKRTYANFRDSYKFNIAAYRLDRLLGLNMVPVSVARKVGGREAAVTWWVDDVAMMELERHEQRIAPPDPPDWSDQKHQARVFNQLIYNADPNLGNFLITTDWKLWLIDFTRAFRPYAQLEQPELLIRIDRRLYRGLRDLDAERVRRELGDYLTRAEIQTLLVRREKLLEHFATRVGELGEAVVVCDRPGH